MPDGIHDLSRGMAAGGADAVDRFYRTYFAWMYTQAKRSTRRDESFCLDVVQEAVLRVIRTVKPVESEPRFRAWLKLVVQTTAYDQLRSETRRTRRETQLIPAGSVEAVDDSERTDWLRDQIAAMDPELVRIIELRFEQRWTLRRIGNALGLSVGAIDGRLRRSLQQLRTSAAEVFDE